MARDILRVNSNKATQNQSWLGRQLWSFFFSHQRVEWPRKKSLIRIDQSTAEPGTKRSAWKLALQTTFTFNTRYADFASDDRRRYCSPLVDQKSLTSSPNLNVPKLPRSAIPVPNDRQFKSDCSRPLYYPIRITG